MTDRTILLTAEGLDSLRTGIITVRASDSDGRPVVLFPQQVWESATSRADDPVVVLSADDLEAIERQPDGLPCPDATGATGWTVRLDECEYSMRAGRGVCASGHGREVAS